MIYIGIDPGATGAAAILWENTVGHHSEEIFDWNNKLGYELPPANTICAIERVHAMPGQGVTSMFKFGTNFGWWLGTLDFIYGKYHLVTPQVWKKHFGLIGKEKDAARIKAIELFPRSADQLKRKKDIGRADALLIALYAKEKNLQ